ncbi:dihydrodipicolinate synthase family protein [Propioniciclava sinopodophylli]|uniref:Dihydrodipicolinate synthase family protein n=1 Tax=Propioniciclava sinopodophylli TaxID=1837344 RepID=A0A4Q9KDA9_9ACTN|nr:dihydrodipicolinate synthase family protein [Propioniciclava sinopodophylli]TBT83029.1 dihydrodipicolinate synthase family protein [Propioniciclava sinopodophylli]
MTIHLHGAIPAMPLLLDTGRRVDWDAQRAVTRYYLAAGVDGLAVGVHTTQFELHHDPALLRDVWALVKDETVTAGRDITLVAGVCGDVAQAHAETAVAAQLGYDAALLCSNGMAEVTEDAVLAKSRAVGDTLPVIGFYLQESVGGVRLSLDFWRRLVDQPSTVGIKAAPFDRYRTRDVAVAILESDRWQEVALLTGNDDAIVADLVMPHRRIVGGQVRELRCAGGLLGQFAVGAKRATELTHHAVAEEPHADDLLSTGNDLVEVNAAVFDVAHGFEGCVAGVNEVLRQQGLARSAVCLSEREALSHGQSELIANARARFPDLFDEDFIAENLDHWLR